ncbi:MAG TPA: C4-type zinc ribbon domain-containing protein [Anaerolineae bacterium]|jgi:predicted  nucleic acid-binding Zn-ribbon protein|nr:C4-type zinc ribbon domain-containing protein [Anaerolineae bacterium]
MNEHKALSQLQEIDSHLDALNYREKNLPERDNYVMLKEEVDKIEGLHNAISKKLHDEELIQKRLEDKIDSLSAKIDREQGRLYSGTITNPKELAGIQQELGHLKEQADEVETELLEQIDVVDKLRSDSNAVEERLTSRRAELAEAKSKMEAALADIDEKRRHWQAKREPVYASLSEETRALYNRVRIKQPLAVTVLEEGICQGCRVELPSTEAERILSSAKLERCPNCSRILVKV